MTKRETGAWLPITAAVVGLALYFAGIATWERKTPISVPIFICSGIGILAGPFLPWAVCFLSRPWREYHQAALLLGSIPLSCCVAVWFWEFEQHRLLPVCACLLIAALQAWVGTREFLKARKSPHTVEQTVESC
jgi:nitrate/nitrite transporter NarK